MNDSLFEDIEQDNNPSFYGNQSILNDPYGHGHNGHANNGHVGSGESNGSTVHSNGTGGSNTRPNRSSDYKTSTGGPNPPNNDLINSTLGISNQIHTLINDPKLKIDIISSERLVNSSVIVYSIQLSLGDSNKDRDSSANSTFGGSTITGSTYAGSSTYGASNSDGSIIVKRRYSEFKSLRDNLLKLYPTLIIPPIPEKHSIFSFIVNSINNSNEVNIIEMRKRYFKNFLKDLIFESSSELRNCVLLHKFLDPNYELCWYNAINEPPANLIPDNLLLANPINPIDQNGLYSLLPQVNGFDFDSTIDNLSSLKKLNEDLAKLKEQIKLFDLKGKDFSNSLNAASEFEEEMANGFKLFDEKFDRYEEIPKNLVHFELKFHHIIKILNDLNKLNSRSVKNYKSITTTLIELGGNLNNFSLQIYESSNYNQSRETEEERNEHNSLSLAIEKFGSTIDSNFLNFESFIMNSLIPEWQEPIHQLVQYYITSLHLIKFYKYKIIQFKLLYKLKFSKFQDLVNLSSTSGLTISSDASSTSPQKNLDHLKDLNSPSLNSALQRIEARKRKGGLSTKKSWYGLFGGNNGYNKQYSQNLLSGGEENEDLTASASLPNQLRFKSNQIQKELNKLNQLIELSNKDMIKLTEELSSTFEEFLIKLEKKWLILMIKYIQNGKQLFQENLSNWNELHDFLTTN